MLPRRALLLSLLPAAFAGAGARAQAGRASPPEVAAELPQARLHGEGRMRFLMMSICDARLWTLPGFKAEAALDAPLALELEYARTLYGALIADRSLTEMQRVARVSEADGARWLAQMKSIFPDVREGDRLTGVQRPGEATHFYFNGKPRGVVRDAAFTQAFFSIWLSPRTADPALREQLIGHRG